MPRWGTVHEKERPRVCDTLRAGLLVAQTPSAKTGRTIYSRAIVHGFYRVGGGGMVWKDTDVIVLLMGVSGAGKTTVGTLLASQLGWEVADADDYHPAANGEKMRNGIPLTDADRGPWLEELRC